MNAVTDSEKLRLLHPDQVRGHNDTAGQCHCEEQSDEEIAAVREYDTELMKTNA
jgi:hypothetical protein